MKNKYEAHLPCSTCLHVSEKANFQRAMHYTNLQHVSRTAFLGFINEDAWELFINKNTWVNALWACFKLSSKLLNVFKQAAFRKVQLTRQTRKANIDLEGSPPLDICSFSPRTLLCPRREQDDRGLSQKHQDWVFKCSIPVNLYLDTNIASEGIEFCNTKQMGRVSIY